MNTLPGGPEQISWKSKIRVQADLMPPPKCWIRVGEVCEEARTRTGDRTATFASVVSLRIWLAARLGFRLRGGLSARGSADSAHVSSPQKPEAGDLLTYLPSMQNPIVPRSDPKVYEKMASAKS